MAKRRPPLPLEMAELAAQKAEAIRLRDKREAELAFSLSQGSKEFHDFVFYFGQTFGPRVLDGLREVFDDVQLNEVKLAYGVQDQFLRQLEKTGFGQLVPAFHGTNSTNYHSIFDRGLLIPGFGAGVDVPMAHGAAHGRGIYTANVDAAWLSKGFCSDSSMLVCAVLKCGGQIRHAGDAMVVMDPAFVVPVFLAVGTWRAQASPGRAALPVPLPTAPNPNLKVPKLIGSKDAKVAKDPKDSKGADVPKPKTKQSKFLARLAARSKRH